jgi:hypothetical protein
VCNTPGSTSIEFQDYDTSTDNGSLTVPITVTAQPGSVMLPDGGFPMPATDASADAAGDAASE